MTRPKTIDEAIKFAEELSTIYKECEDEANSIDQANIAEWLKELKRWRALAALKQK